MQTGVPPGAARDRRLEVVKDDLSRTALEEFQGMHQRPVELRLALGEAEFDVQQPAIAEHRHEDRDPPRRLADHHASAVAPIHLHGLARLVEHLLIHASPCRSDLVQITPHRVHAASIPALSLGYLLRDSHRGKIGVLGHQGLDPRAVRVENICPWLRFPCGGRRHGQRLGDGLGTTVQAAGNGAGRETFDLVQTADFRPERDFHEDLRGLVGEEGSARLRRISPKAARPPPRRWIVAAGKASTCANGAR